MMNNVVNIANHPKFQAATVPAFNFADRSSAFVKRKYKNAGDLLSDFGVLRGDKLLCDPVFNESEIVNQICIIRLFEDDSLFTAQVIPNYDGTATLKRGNAAYSDLIMKLSEFEAVAVVTGIERTEVLQLSAPNFYGGIQ